MILEQQLEIALNKIAQGEVIAYPTEAVFGLGCDPFNEQAVDDLLALKQRPVEKGMILVAASPSALAQITEVNHQPWTDKVLNSWTNPEQAITWLLPKKPNCPHWISGEHSTVAVRVSHHPVVKRLCGDGVLVSTSANLAGQPPARSCQDVAGYFQDRVWCLDAPLGGLLQPSQIWDAQSGKRLR
jgi:L-threonylcarbamoyladenylate synthase